MDFLAFINKDDVQQVHQTTLRLLDEVGIILGHAEGREILASSGAKVEGERVHLPPELVEYAMKKAPDTVSVTCVIIKRPSRSTAPGSLRGIAKSISAGPSAGASLAKSIALRSEPGPPSLVLLTTK